MFLGLPARKKNGEWEMIEHVIRTVPKSVWNLANGCKSHPGSTNAQEAKYDRYIAGR